MRANLRRKGRKRTDLLCCSKYWNTVSIDTGPPRMAVSEETICALIPEGADSSETTHKRKWQTAHSIWLQSRRRAFSTTPSDSTGHICIPLPHFRSTISRTDSRLVALAKLPAVKCPCSEAIGAIGAIGASLTSNRSRYFAPMSSPAEAETAVKLTAGLSDVSRGLTFLRVPCRPFRDCHVNAESLLNA